MGEERHEAREGYHSAFREPVSLAHEPALRALLLVDRPGDVGVGPSLARELADDGRSCGRERHRPERGGVLQHPHGEHAFGGSKRHRPTAGQIEHAAWSGGRQREPGSLRQPARRRRDDEPSRTAPAKVTRKRVTSAADGRGVTRRAWSSARRSSSPMISRATARLAPPSRRAARYDALLPSNRETMIRRSMASICSVFTIARWRSTDRTTSAVSASSRSPVTFDQRCNPGGGERASVIQAANAGW